MENIDDGQKQRSKKVTEAEELVKYMSDLPQYLKRSGRGGNVQEKALNFGVLDWNRLERWKYDQKKVLGGGNVHSASSSETLSSSTFGSSTQSSRSDCETSSHARRQSLSLDFYLNLSAKEGHSNVLTKRSSRKDTALNDDLKTAPQRDQSIGRQHPRSELEKSNRNDSCSKVLSHNTCQTSANVLSNLNGYAASARAKGKTKARDGKSKSRVEQSQESGVHLLDENCVNGLDSYEFLSIRECRKDRSPESCLRYESSAFHDIGLTEKNHKWFSEDFDFQFNLSSAIPHSCPFPCNSESSEWPDMRASNLVDVQDTETPFDVSHSYADSGETKNIRSKDKHEEQQNQSISRPTELLVVKSCNGVGPGKAKTVTETAKNQSSSRRSTSILKKTSRSFSFKEVSAAQQVNSTFPHSTHADSSNRDKASASRRAKSSPLRRILDPLLKPKASNHLSSDNLLSGSHEFGGLHKHQSNDILMSTNGAKSFNARSNSVKRNLNSSTWASANTHEKHMGLKKRALLQLACKNGLPLFTFTFNDCDILAAMMRKVYVSGKDDFELVYTFYSIHEVKKNRGWINQGIKNKGHGYASNVVGQMKVSCSQCQKLTGDDVNNHMLREFVMFSAEPKQAAHDALDFQPNNELAAIVVNVPKEKGSFGGDEWKSNISQMESARCLSQEGDSCHLAENKSRFSIVVLLPGGVHSQPATAGIPSTLIDRWRSGGSCDCGGWDVGCALRVLSSQGQESVSLSSSHDCHISNETHQVDLFIQGGAQEHEHVFSLASFKEGLYTVDFDASISLLQAFSICIAILHGGKPANLSELHNILEMKSSSEPDLAENNKIKAPNRSQVKIPASYVTYPPHSPVGRV